MRGSVFSDGLAGNRLELLREMWYAAKIEFERNISERYISGIEQFLCSLDFAYEYEMLDGHALRSRKNAG